MGVVGGGLAVVTLRNIIHSAVAMMICFGSLAGMYALLGAPIVAAAQVLIYLGAISVLILFAIMLTQAGDANLPAPFHRQLPVAAVVALAMAGLIVWAVIQTDWGMTGEVVGAAVDAIATSAASHTWRWNGAGRFASPAWVSMIANRIRTLIAPR